MGGRFTHSCATNVASDFVQIVGSIKEAMGHTLRAVRSDHNLLVATMQVFVVEPSVDWLKFARDHARDMAIEDSAGMFLTCFNPKSFLRLNFMKKKTRLYGTQVVGNAIIQISIQLRIQIS